MYINSVIYQLIEKEFYGWLGMLGFLGGVVAPVLVFILTLRSQKRKEKRAAQANTADEERLLLESNRSNFEFILACTEILASRADTIWQDLTKAATSAQQVLDGVVPMKKDSDRVDIPIMEFESYRSLPASIAKRAFDDHRVNTSNINFLGLKSNLILLEKRYNKFFEEGGRIRAHLSKVIDDIELQKTIVRKQYTENIANLAIILNEPLKKSLLIAIEDKLGFVPAYDYSELLNHAVEANNALNQVINSPEFDHNIHAYNILLRFSDSFIGLREAVLRRREIYSAEVKFYRAYSISFQSDAESLFKIIQTKSADGNS